MGRLLALLTDFGTQDPYAGIMKGVILRMLPDARIVDLTHQIPPQDVHQAAFALACAVPYFPAETMFVAVVDPGVGTSRRALVVQCDGPTFVAPDNGLLTFALDLFPPRGAWVANRREFFLPHVSQTFHGRDVFAPVAAHLALGRRPDELGDAIDPAAIMRLPASKPVWEADRVTAMVTYVDRFGNLITNLHERDLAHRAVSAAQIGKVRAVLAPSYRAVGEGQLLSIWGSSGYLEISQSMGCAAATLKLGVGDPITVLLAPAGSAAADEGGS